MESIITTDNNLVRPRLLTEAEKSNHLSNLLFLSSKSLFELNKDHPNLLIFPQDFEIYGDKIGKERMFMLDGDKLVTSNIMGFVGFNGTQVSIRSRFAQEDGKDFFLHYMLQRVLCLNLFDLDFQSDCEQVFDFLIYLFPGFLKKALRQGLYREYQTRNYNDANIRGRIDVSRHIRHNIPFAGNVAYSTREYIADNHVTQLIRHTIEYIRQHPMGSNILNNDEDTKKAVASINACTSTYNKLERQKVTNQNLQPLSHPYYSAYRDLQRLCVQILRHEDMKYGADDNQIHGILFDGAWLWEEYLNTFLNDLLTHPRNKTKEGRLNIFDDGRGECYPDFYNKERGVVLDAKYKGYSNWGKVQNEDLFQVMAYMHIINGTKGGFLVPTKKKVLATKTLTGEGNHTMSVLGMPVDYVSSDFYRFCQYMSRQESILHEQIQDNFA